MADARDEARRRIVARLRYAPKDLRVAGNAEHIADTVLDLFPVAFWIPNVLNNSDRPATRYLALRANAEPTPTA